MNILSKSINIKRIIAYTLTLLTVFFLLSVFLFPNISNLNNLVLKNRFNSSFSLFNIFSKKTDPVKVEKYSIFAEELHPIYGTPKKLLISSLDIKIPVIPVGVDANGYLETPKDWNTAGWYQKGARPAENGNLLINAHYDNNLGNPAAFYRLKNIKLGDTVSVLDSYGKEYTYAVVNTYYIDINDPERSKVFEVSEKDKSAMTLITCGGVWIGDTYNKRFVVNAELIQ
jgi:LPXTG-site transpeptidase (sortase) family protein